ncbi:MAG: acyltransferase [Deltaproteobacteria bacterium]|nr:acyltransferase [Deltaproteobacteria bacterium]MBI3391477.1 acyltransferase [Deltaproteobacteria bacterium]
MVATQSTRRRKRYASIDYLKAAAILTVIWIHAYLTLWRAQVGIVLSIEALTRFAVPAFLFASGFLAFSPARVDFSHHRARVTRILVPYLVASAIAIAGRWLVLGPLPLNQIAKDLLTGDAVGVYYFMMPLIVATLLSWPLARVPGAMTPVLAVLVATAWLCERGTIAFSDSSPLDAYFWNLRNPLRWLGYFVAGCWAAQHVAWIVTVRRGPRIIASLGLLGTAVVLSLALAYPPGTSWQSWQSWQSWIDRATLEYAVIYASVLGLFLLAMDWPEQPIVRWLSDATYPIYLYHFFFIAGFRYGCRDTLHQQWGLSNRVVDSITFVVGAAGALAVVYLGRRAFGRAARIVIG